MAASLALVNMPRCIYGVDTNLDRCSELLSNLAHSIETCRVRNFFLHVLVPVLHVDHIFLHVDHVRKI